MFIVVSGIAPAKGDLVIGQGDESVVGGGDAIGVPLDAALAESLLKLRLVGPYNHETDWVFASPTMKGKQPPWPETLWRRYGRPAVKAAKIQKRVRFHTFRHTYTTLLTQNNSRARSPLLGDHESISQMSVPVGRSICTECSEARAFPRAGRQL